jgi:hypothetical protein
MKRLTFPRSIATGVILAFLALGCAGGSGDGEPTTPSLPREGGRVILSLGTAGELGGRIEIPVDFAEAVDLYALSFRVGFDPEGLRPESVEWSDVVGDEGATFELVNQPGIIPLALVRLDGNRGIEGSGILCVLRFEVLDPGRASPWIVADPGFLVAYDSLKRPVALVVGGEAR